MKRKLPQAAWILIAMVIGIVLGYMIFVSYPDKKVAGQIAGYVSIISDVFLRLMHEGLGQAEAEQRKLDVSKEIITRRHFVEPIQTKLKSAFPVMRGALSGEVKQLAVAPTSADAALARDNAPTRPRCRIPHPGGRRPGSASGRTRAPRRCPAPARPPSPCATRGPPPRAGTGCRRSRGGGQLVPSAQPWHP